MSALWIMTLIGVIAFLSFWLGSIVGQYAQIEYQARLKGMKASQSVKDSLPDEQEWRKLLEKKQ